MAMGEKALTLLASRYGITVEPPETEISRTDADDTLIALLSAIGLPITSPAHADTLLQQTELQEWLQVLEPVLVIQEGTLPLPIPLRLPEEAVSETVWTLIEENGSRHDGRCSPADLPVESLYESGEGNYVLRTLSLGIDLPCGYHAFQLHVPGQAAAASQPSLKLIITPTTCYVPTGIRKDNRIWGLGVHLHAIRSRRNWGIGDYTDLKHIIAMGAEQGAGTVSTTPLHATALSAPRPSNPYRPSCRSLFNIAFLDVEAIPDFAECDEAVSQVNDVKFQARLANLQDEEYIDFGSVIQTKQELFKLLWYRFSANHLDPETKRGREFRSFQDQGGDTLRYYGIFETLRNTLQTEKPPSTDWRNWPEDFRDPESATVAEFADQNQHEIEFFHYLQWQADIQMAALGRRSMELGLKMGLLSEFTCGPDPAGFETWYYRDLFLPSAAITANPDVGQGQDPGAGLAPLMPDRLKKMQFTPFIEALRASMHHAGALLIRGVTNYWKTTVSLSGQKPNVKISIDLPFPDLFAIIALESQRNRCLILVDNLHLLPAELQDNLLTKQIFTQQSCMQARDDQGNWPSVADYLEEALLSASAPFLATIKGYWLGKDIAVKTDERIFKDPAEMENAIIARASDRAHLLIALHHEGLLPTGYNMDPATVPKIDQELFRALQIYLARTPAKVLLVYMNDLLGMEEQAVLPELTGQTFWATRYPVYLEKIQAEPEILSLFHDLCRERGLGVIRPSAPAADRKKRRGISIPTAFYRLQLNKDFTFFKAAEIIPYLKELGISHCYTSPFLMARPGSAHGYDIIDHAVINPEIGSREDFESFIAALEQHHMALLLDIVPNHMGIGSDNKWWMDVLENGEASIHADFFDINWQPLQPELAGRVLLPVLGDHYGRILENNELALSFQDTMGIFSIKYYDHLFPVAPETYPAILGHDLRRLEDRLGNLHSGYLELQNLISSFTNLPSRYEISEEERQVRHRNKEVNKRILARLCREHPEIRQFIEENVILFNGEPDKPESHDPLHTLLENQPYRLAFWRVAADEINYRRFFDINDLAGLRMENIKVFQETHRLVLDLINTGKLDGLRIDHPDGLFDPYQYFSRLQNAATGEPLADLETSHLEPRKKQRIPLYVVAEKILADFEHLPDSWPVNGSTGYDFANMLNGLFVDGSAKKTMTTIYHRAVGKRMDFDNILYESKKLIIRSAMAGELNVLTSELYRLAQSDRATRDFTLNSLRDALTEIVANFPVYRTYITGKKIPKHDINFISWAIAKAKKQQPLADISVFDFIQSVLLLQNMKPGYDLQRYLYFVMKFQQYTAPVMAKGMEDTCFYIYNRLLSLNEVGGDPKRFGTSVAAFHRTNQDRMQHWPHAMLNTSTHDSKRSEDVRARINVLTEMPQEWQKRFFLWSKLNRPLKSQSEERFAPTKNDEYAYYQNLLGSWPSRVLADEERREYISRITDYMLKTIRESKEHTSWMNPDEWYEKAMVRFVEGSFAEKNDIFINDFLSFHQDISWFGMLNSLAQVLLKLVATGVPDIYQGNEIWHYCLVDPDNRRPVDFQKRRALLNDLLERLTADPEERSLFLQELLANLEDGRAKMATTAITLRYRNSWKDVFEQGDYLPLEVQGEKQLHLCAFARKSGERIVIAAVPRLCCTLLQGRRILPLNETVWSDTTILLPPDFAGVAFQNVFSAERLQTASEHGPTLKASQVFGSWPVGLLYSPT